MQRFRAFYVGTILLIRRPNKSYGLINASIQFRELERLLVKTPFSAATVIWSSSLEASPTFYDSEDWQLLKSKHSYECSKYQIDLIATHLDRMSRPSRTKKIRHYVSEPGVCSTMISQDLTGPVLDIFKVLIFYVVCINIMFSCIPLLNTP